MIRTLNEWDPKVSGDWRKKLESQREKELLDDRKRLAIEDVVSSKLKSNIPIVRAQ